MAESALSIDIDSLREEVGMRHGWGRSVSAMSAQNLADFDRVSKRALREFYFPAIDPGTPTYEWSFLRKTNTITLVNGTSTYDLPDDCTGVVLDSSFTYSAGVDHPGLIKVPEAQLRRMQASENSDAGWPTCFSLINKAHAPTTGQRYQIEVYPTPGTDADTKTIEYRHVFAPDVLTNANKYPVGGAQYSQVILAAHLAAAELLLDGDPVGPQRQNFITLLTTAVRADEQVKAVNQGGTV